MIAVALFACIVLVGLVAGGLAFMSIAVSTATPTLSSTVFVQVHQALFRMADPIMPIFVVASLLATVPLSVALFRNDFDAAAEWTLLTTIGIGVVVVITRLVNKPINRTVSHWDPKNPPAGWARERSRFNRYHAWRSVIAALSFLTVVGVGIALAAPAASERSLTLIAVLVSGLIAGGLAFMYAVVGRALLTLDGSAYVATHQATSLRATRYMTPLTLASVLSAGGVFVLLWRAGHTVSALLAGGAALASLAVIIISVAVSVPMNRQIAKWDKADPPPEW